MCRHSRAGGRGAKVAASASQEYVVVAAQQGLGHSEQFFDRRLKQHVAVLEQHLAVAVQPKGFERVEVPQPRGETLDGRHARPPPLAQLRRDLLEAYRAACLAKMAAHAAGNASWMTIRSPAKWGWCFRKNRSVTSMPGTKRSVVAVTKHTCAATVGDMPYARQYEDIGGESGRRSWDLSTMLGCRLGLLR